MEMLPCVVDGEDCGGAAPLQALARLWSVLNRGEDCKHEEECKAWRRLGCVEGRVVSPCVECSWEREEVHGSFLLGVRRTSLWIVGWSRGR